MRLGIVAGHLAGLLLAGMAAQAHAVDYCIDPATGSDTASGRCADQAWATLGPSQTFPFASGDRILLSAGRHVHPLTQWYMKPGVSWIGAGRDRTTVVYNKAVAVPFLRFRTGSAGSGAPGDLRPDRFTSTTVVSDMTLLNEGRASIGIDVASTSGDSAPALRRLQIVGFPTGVAFHPASDERAAASTHALLTNSIIRGATLEGIASFADVFYARLITEASTVTNVAVDVEGVGAVARTLVQNLRDVAHANASPILTNVTLAASGEAALLLVSYYDDGTGVRREQRQAGSTAATIRGSILTGAAGHGIVENSPFNEPTAVENNALGGNALGDYLDEGTITRAAATVGTGNVSVIPLFVDRAGGDLHVLAGSPTIDTLASGPSDDMDGHARPQGARWDMGADEWVACTAMADASATRQAPPCTGGASTLDASLSGVDAVCAAGPAFQWIQGTAVISTNETFDVSPLAPTDYVLRVRCADPALSACVAETTVSVDPSSAPPTVDAGPGGSACASTGEAIVFDLAGTAAAAPPSTLSFTAWTVTAGSVDAPGALATRLRVTATGSAQVITATLTATDDQGCSTQDTVEFRIDPVPGLVLAAPEAHCHDPADASVRVALSAPVTGGTPPHAHAWTSSAGTITGGEDAVLTLPASAASRSVDVSVVVTDGAGCAAEERATIRIVPWPVADAGPDAAACGAPGSDASAPLDGSGSTGEPGLRYAWSAPEGVIADPDAATTSITLAVTATPRPVTVTLDVLGPAGDCVRSDQVIITAGPGPTARAGDDAFACTSPGTRASVPLDASASSGEPPLAFAWSTSAGTIADPSSAITQLDIDVAADPVTAIVTVEVTDARGTCTASDQVIVMAGPAAVADAGADSAACPPPSGPLVVTLDGTGSTGPPPLLMAWSSSEGVIADPTAALTTLTLAGSPARVVTVQLQVGDASGECVDVDAREITVSARTDANPGGPYTAVQGTGATSLVLDGAAGAGNAPLTWTWTTDLGLFQDTGTTTSALQAPTVIVPEQPATQRGLACLEILSAAGCTAGPACTDVVVTLVAVQPPRDPSPTLRVSKAPPSDVALTWQEAPIDATHDAATAYDVLASGAGCGPFPRLMRVAAVPGTNSANDPILLGPPAARWYFVRSINDGGASLPPAPDASGCR